jgi:2-oxoisovalerate dehydrogenase E2 component (dihydrolipoyl transacylase)
MNSLYHSAKNPYEYDIYSGHNISIAIDSPNGLVVPHIKNVNSLNLGQIQQELERLRNLSKEAKLTSK